MHCGDVFRFFSSACVLWRRYLATARSLEVDGQITEDLRTMLFVNPGNAAGLDLAVFNIQRGREHGLPDYNTMREAYGLPRRR